ncbi:4-coumarate-CoA ligase [Aulographum hederae CBS 113979]|uniref:4-coumarate-CoA ligase n=1 Tax=Aulographum hederae CBS 113979 TaxID=1176131 RepID=A0A6G1HDR5_9PEZI|nr:4-coumarate-CoA ligase [Aulographum hederae CBS 113979]
MPQQSPFTISIPSTNILSYVFPSKSPASNEPLYISASNPTTFLSPAQLLQQIKRVGHTLTTTLSIPTQSVALVISYNSLSVPVFYLGIAGSGRIFSGVNPAYGVKEITWQIKDTQAKVIFVEKDLLSRTLEACKEVGFPREKVFLVSDVEGHGNGSEEEGSNGVKDWTTLLKGQEKEADKWEWPHMSEEDAKTNTAVLNYSSGTTGLPKGVMITHTNVIANVAQSLYMRELSHSTPKHQRDPEHWLGFLPLYHAYGQLWSIVAAAKTLTPTYFMRQFSFPDFLANIERHRISHIQTAPPVLVMLAKRPETEKYDLSSLCNILCGAAPLSKELQNEVSDRFGLKVVQTWGMTEVTCSSLHVPGGLDERSGSVGYIDPNCSIKLVDDSGEEVGEGERGEILVKGPNICLGYWRNEKATKETFDEEGYLRTGDVAVRDQKGWYWIVDRKKELIKVKGYQVPPAELEAALLENEAVADAAVVGLQMEHEERPRAYVALKDEAKGKISEKDIEEWMAQRVAKHKRLTGGVAFVEEVPKSPSGKIQRKIMKEWALEDAKKMKEGPKAKL